MKKLNLLKSLFLLCALIVGSSSVWAEETATITFASQTSGTSDGSTAYTTSTFVSNGIASSSDAFGTITCSATSKCYSGKTGYGMKAGASSSAGSFTIAFSTPLTNVSQITLNRASYNDSKTANITVKNGSTTLANAVSTPSGSAAFSDMDITDLAIESLAGLTVEATKYCYIKSITITYSTSSKPSAGLAFAVPSYKVAYDTDFPTPTLTNPHSLTVSYSSSDDDIALVEENTGFVVIGSKAGTATITASSAETSDYAAGVAKYTITVFDPAANDGTEAKPYTVAEALAIIDGLADNGKTDKVYVKGIVSTGLGTISSGAASYSISDDGSTTGQMLVYKGYGNGGYEFENATDLSVGDKVIVYGQLYKYKSGTTITPEFAKDNYITSLEGEKYIYVGDAKWRTYVAEEDMEMPADLKAYIVTSTSTSSVALTEVTKVKKGTAVILNGTNEYGDYRDNDYFCTILNETVTYPGTNVLKISNGTTVNGVFVLAKKSDVVGFYKWNGGSLEPGRAYVEAPAGDAREYLEFAFNDNGTTGIANVDINANLNGNYYNLAGQRVAQPSKGLYIVNGKKVIIK